MTSTPPVAVGGGGGGAAAAAAAAVVVLLLLLLWWWWWWGGGEVGSVTWSYNAMRLPYNARHIVHVMQQHAEGHVLHHHQQHYVWYYNTITITTHSNMTRVFRAQFTCKPPHQRCPHHTANPHLTRTP